MGMARHAGASSGSLW